MAPSSTFQLASLVGLKPKSVSPSNRLIQPAAICSGVSWLGSVGAGVAAWILSGVDARNTQNRRSVFTNSLAGRELAKLEGRVLKRFRRKRISKRKTRVGASRLVVCEPGKQGVLLC